MNIAVKKKTIFNTLIGDKAFYMMVLGIAVPMMVQNGITNFVGMLDNIMIGRIGTEPMSGASIVNQLLFVYNLCIFGGVSGAGIFTAQYYGQKDIEGVRQTFRFKFWLGLFLTFSAIVVFYVWGQNLIGIYLTGEGQDVNAALTLKYGLDYLKIMLFGLPVFMLGQVYCSTLRECGETVLPMKAGVFSVFLNLVLNYVLIYGKFGFPELGVAGAAIATVISRYMECGIILYFVWKKSEEERFSFVKGLYRTLKVPAKLCGKIVKKGLPLLLNETLWAAGISFLVQCYSIRGLDVIAGLNISNTINNVFNIVFIALGDSVAIIVGQLLGAGEMEKARDTDTKLIAFSVFCCSIVATIMFFIAPFFPKVYNTSDSVRMLGTRFIQINACIMPLGAFLHACYFTLRSGGKTIITFLFDSVYIWVVSVVFAFVLSRYTNLGVLWVFALVQLSDSIKAVIGFILVKKGVWLQNIVSDS